MSAVFDAASAKLEELTVMSRLQCRGTVRLICSNSGYDKPEQVSKKDMAELLGESLATELEKRGIEDGASVTASVIAAVKMAPEVDSAYDAFSRI